MSTSALSGNDAVTINNRLLVNLADGNCVELTYPNDIANVKIGKNGNAIYGLNENGKQAEVKLRLIRGSDDDKFLIGLLSQQQANFAGTVLLTGSFVKNMGNGKGVLNSDTYIMSGGVFMKQIEAKSNQDGETEQSVSMYTIRFSQAVRVIT